MVEDEFYTIAQSFTQHLHYAEYIRRKKEAKAQSTEALNDIQRPTDGRTQLPKEAVRRKEAEALAARQKAGLAHLEEPEAEKNDSDDDDTWAGTHLHGLLTSPRKSRSLVGAHAMKSSTRAAAGFRQAAGANSDRAAASVPFSRAAVAQMMMVISTERRLRMRMMTLMGRLARSGYHSRNAYKQMALQELLNSDMLRVAGTAYTSNLR
jgi:hypothetical protein